jgi:hypothetical protein
LHQLAALAAAAAAAAAAAGAGAGAAAAAAAADTAEENAAQRAAFLEHSLAAAMAVAACSEGALGCPAQHFATPSLDSYHCMFLSPLLAGQRQHYIAISVR